MIERLLIYGGAFNPPHIGHIALLESAVGAVAPDRTLVIPSKFSPHKRDGGVPFWDRFRMCRCFVGIKGVRRSAIEYFLPGKSYTVRTAKKLARVYPKARLYLLIGTDMLSTFTAWRSYRELLSICTLVAGAREGDDAAEIEAAAKALEKEGGRVIILKNKPVTISSTAIRSDFAAFGYSRFVTPEVSAYIVKRGLYADA